MSNGFIVHTGKLVNDYLQVMEIEPRECSLKIGMSEKDLSEFLNGKIILDDEYLVKLQDVIPDIPASYWINYNKKYIQYISEKESQVNVYSIDQLKKFSNRFKFKSIFEGLDWSLERQANEMLKLLKIDSFEQFDFRYSNLEIDFMQDGGELESIAVWLNLAGEEVEIQNKNLEEVKFDNEKLIKMLPKFKLLSLNDNYKDSLKSARKLLNRLGVYLVVYDAVENSKVRGALTTYEGSPAIYLTGRFKTHDHVWFALMHEIGHLLKHYDSNKSIITFEEDFQVETDKKEEEANEFARDFFIDKKDYTDFINNKIFSSKEIMEFANSQKVLPGIVVARLQHDGHIGYDKLNYLKNR
ncbi:ImmA/IrrE family metallo-endopeptidase [Exiguobacterium sp. SRB7LM]|uniref:ImmA/IrrE family metallo-endopeptidase n=1 Tax=Exiguobacterium sp. SRB7LM TaxID=2608401 RepID=UPI0018C3EEE6|nr:ImmA/IrrE family metallo-endopeptidase [Exiguobacterium sp. SRB7LM]MBG0916406.1 ImmA/IrrE family metallo-endopeptidase [Exiguobacterium sp. SRB7LM]